MAALVHRAQSDGWRRVAPRRSNAPRQVARSEPPRHGHNSAPPTIRSFSAHPALPSGNAPTVSLDLESLPAPVTDADERAALYQRHSVQVARLARLPALSVSSAAATIDELRLLLPCEVTAEIDTMVPLTKSAHIDNKGHARMTYRIFFQYCSPLFRSWQILRLSPSDITLKRSQQSS